MLGSFRPRFKTLVDTLMSHPRVRVTHVWIGAPATDAAVDEPARTWGHPIPARID